MKQLFSRKAQNLTELALIIATLGLVLIAMQTYVKRGLQGRVKDLTDQIVGAKQEPYASDVSSLSSMSSSATTSMDPKYNSVTRTTLVGGGRQTVKSEIVSVTSTSDSVYNTHTP